MDYTDNAVSVTPTLTVTQGLSLTLIDATGTSFPLQAEFSYSASDPYAVTTVFHAGEAKIRWTFGRDLLSGGLFEPTGEGDVHVWPCLDADGRAVVIIELRSPDGEALVQARTDELSRFVNRTAKLVPFGLECEHVDVEATISSILALPTG